MANRLKEDEKNERIIRNLLKLPENRRCINCNSLGPQYVCTNFSTFVCTNCSGIHREFTHRVKSVSMAKFTPQEVSALQEGGNARAREIYLKEWDPQRNSLPNCSNIERLRDFIRHVYVDRRYTGERNLEKPLRAKMGETDDFYENRRIDTHQGGSPSPPYDTSERRYGASVGGKSPANDKDNWRNSSHKRSPARTEVINDWRREDRFGNGRRFEDRSSDGRSKLEVRSSDSERGLDMSSPPIVRPVRDILGDNVSPLRVTEPPKSFGGRSTDGLRHSLGTASSSSLTSSDANPSEIKLEASFIDFDAVSDLPTVPQTEEAVAADALSVQLNKSSGNDWANFDSVQEAGKTVPSSSMESVLSELLTEAPKSGLSAPVGTLPPIQSSSSQGSSTLLASFGSAVPQSAFPSGGAPAASLGPEAQSSNLERNLLTDASTGGQWPTMIPQQHFVSPGGVTQFSSQIVTPVIGGPSSNKPWNLLVSNSHTPPDTSIGQVDQTAAFDNNETSTGLTTKSSLDAKSGGRKALPEDLFAMNYSYGPSLAAGWYSGSPYVAPVPMQYNNTHVAIPSFQSVSRSINPFDASNDPSPAQASIFPSVASLQGALPQIGNPSGPPRTSRLETSQLHIPSMLAQTPSAYGSAPPTGSFFGAGIAGNMAPSPKGQSGFTLDESAFSSLNHQNPQLGGLRGPHSASSSFSGNPFG
ncbi:NSP (nuclear shuttle protein)-interacting GTPase [Striga hermonthica]|uniref:NSP (Nuclear shuttle protein)-interacting GTPase n=1 Tax=Striga hermonthica TaxID=68872 RepID=A0A9N7R1N9_STRHE|nr:NSP (nuclear shuttle protein)-interacting GTPase [Striga hermonthica]